MRLIFMGTSDFAVPSLLALIKSGYPIVGVYTQPPRPKNRGYHITKSPIHRVAEAHNLPIFTPVSLRDLEQQQIFKRLQADVAVVAAYGLILPKAILEAPRKGCINIHGSLLPRWRGAAPLHRAMLAGDGVTGVTLMQMDEGLDTGDIVRTMDYRIDPSASFQQVHDDMSRLGANLLLETLPPFMNAEILPQKQPESGVTYAHKLTKEEGRLDWRTPVKTLLRQVKVLNPWPGTYTFYKGTLIKIREASLISNANFITHNLVPGTLLPDGCIACTDGIFSPDVLQREGGKPLAKDVFLRGYPLEVGEQLG